MNCAALVLELFSAGSSLKDEAEDGLPDTGVLSNWGGEGAILKPAVPTTLFSLPAETGDGVPHHLPWTKKIIDTLGIRG